MLIFYLYESQAFYLVYNDNLEASVSFKSVIEKRILFCFILHFLPFTGCGPHGCDSQHNHSSKVRVLGYYLNRMGRSLVGFSGNNTRAAHAAEAEEGIQAVFCCSHYCLVMKNFPVLTYKIIMSGIYQNLRGHVFIQLAVSYMVK